MSSTKFKPLEEIFSGYPEKMINLERDVRARLRQVNYLLDHFMRGGDQIDQKQHGSIHNHILWCHSSIRRLHHYLWTWEEPAAPAAHVDWIQAVVRVGEYERKITELQDEYLYTQVESVEERDGLEYFDVEI